MRKGSRTQAMIMALLAMVVVCRPVAAQLGIMPIHIGAALGGAFPLSDFGNAFSTGFNVTGTIAVTPPLIPVGFRGDVVYNHFGSKGASNATAKIAGASANAIFGMPGVIITPYVIGGIGYYHVSSSLTGTTASNHFGFNAGAGLNVPLLVFKAFVEARYNRISESGGSTSFVPVTVGVMF